MILWSKRIVTCMTALILLNVRICYESVVIRGQCSMLSGGMQDKLPNGIEQHPKLEVRTLVRRRGVFDGFTDVVLLNVAVVLEHVSFCTSTISVCRLIIVRCWMDHTSSRRIICDTRKTIHCSACMLFVAPSVTWSVTQTCGDVTI